MTRHYDNALDAVSCSGWHAASQLRQGQLVTHSAHPGEVLLIDHFDGHYGPGLGGIKWRAWVKREGHPDDIPCPADPEQLIPLTLN